MGSFAWKGRDPRGDLVQGVIDADTDDLVADQLLAIGVSPLSISPRGSAPVAAAPNVWEALTSPPVNDQDLLLLSRQMYTLLKAGVPILRALAGLQTSATKRSVAVVLEGRYNNAEPWRDAKDHTFQAGQHYFVGGRVDAYEIYRGWIY